MTTAEEYLGEKRIFKNNKVKIEVINNEIRGYANLNDLEFGEWPLILSGQFNYRANNNKFSFFMGSSTCLSSDLRRAFLIHECNEAFLKKVNEVIHSI